MVMDTFAALAFAFEPYLNEYMEEKPKRREEPIINYYMKNQIIVTGTYSLLLTLLFLKVPIFKNIFGKGIEFMTSFFALFIFIGIFNSFNSRTHRLNLVSNILKNKMFILIMSIVSFVQIIIIYFGGDIFRTIPITLDRLIIIIAISSTVIPVDFVRKLYLKSKSKKFGV